MHLDTKLYHNCLEFIFLSYLVLEIPKNIAIYFYQKEFAYY